METNKIHIGKIIRNVVIEQGRSITWFSEKIHCHKKIVYDIFKNQNINHSRLIDISIALKLNFFDFYKKKVDEIINTL